MSRKRIGKASDFSAILADVLKDVEQDVTETTDKVAKAVSEDIARDINLQVDAYGWRSLKNTWKVTEQLQGGPGSSRVRINKVYIVHAENYRLPHLLEKGHKMRQGGRARAFPTIRPAEQRGIKEFETKLKASLETNLEKVDTTGTIELEGSK